MIIHENRLLADDSHEISFLISLEIRKDVTQFVVCCSGDWCFTVGTQRAYFELKYFKIVKMRDAKYSLKMAAEKWRQIFAFLNALYS